MHMAGLLFSSRPTQVNRDWWEARASTVRIAGDGVGTGALAGLPHPQSRRSGCEAGGQVRTAAPQSQTRLLPQHGTHIPALVQ